MILPTKVDFAFLDSGTGGLPYMLYLKEHFPDCSCVYLADTKNFPYGEKSPQEIIDASSQAIELLIKNFSPQVIVIACNTISVTALDVLRKRFSVPFVGTVPAIKLAAKISKNKRIGLLATEQTVSHCYTDKLILDFASDCVVIKRGDRDLVRFIEKHLFHVSKTETEKAVMPAISFFQKQQVDTIILGCTHFIHVGTVIQSLVGDEVQVVDSREGVVKQALKLYTPQEKTELTIPDKSFFTTALYSEQMKDDYCSIAKTLDIPWGGLLQETK